jgi:hypothetical protein
MGSEKRRDRRHPFHTRVVVGAGRQTIVAQTADVSFSGIFVRMDCPPPERQLVRLGFTLPPEGDELALTGMVARITQGTPPGVGIRFYAVDPQALRRWQRFIRFAATGGTAEPQPVASAAPSPPAQRAPPSLPTPAPAAPAFPPGTPDAVRRSYPRYTAALRVRLQSVDDLSDLYTRNVSKGGVFVQTSLALKPGTPLRMRVLHPTTGESFSLKAVVRRQETSPEPGLGVEFVQLSEHRRDEFFDFIRGQLHLEEEAVYVAPTDPRLAPAGPPAFAEPEDELDDPEPEGEEPEKK